MKESQALKLTIFPTSVRVCAQLCRTLCDPMDRGAWQGFFRQEYWSGLPFPTPGDLPDPGIRSVSFGSLALTDGFFTASFILV